MIYMGKSWPNGYSRTRNRKVVSSSLRPAGIVGGGEWMYSALSTVNTTTEVTLSKAPNPQLLPRCRSINGCPLLRVCVHDVCVFTAVCVCVLGWVKCRAQIQSMGHHTWSYVTSLMSVCFVYIMVLFTKHFLTLTEIHMTNINLDFFFKY